MPLTFREDPAKLRSSAISMLIICAICLIVGAVMLSNFGSIGYIQSAVGGALLGGGVCGLFLAVKNFFRMRGEPIALISAGEDGVTLNVGDGFQTIPWSEIHGISSMEKGIQKGVALELKDADSYMARLDRKQLSIARQNKSFFGSIASVNTTPCAVTHQEIAQRLNEYRNTLLQA